MIYEILIQGDIPVKTSVYYKAGTVILLSTLCLVSLSCRDSNDPQPQGSARLPDSLFLTAAPDDIQTVSSLKEKASEGDDVVIKVVVGGRKKLFVNDRAVMTVIDATLDNPCTVEDDHCPTPWDYCCTPPEELLPNIASVQILGDDNRPLAVDLSTVEKLKPLTTLVIQGTVGPRSDQNILVIHADGIFVAS